MPWKISHRCNVSDSEDADYAVALGSHDGIQVTRVLCPKASCREEFFIIGHEMFERAEDVRDKYPGLPPGFILPSRRAG
jgi:hypothetical protein